jgi:hypothetical protein
MTWIHVIDGGDDISAVGRRERRAMRRVEEVPLVTNVCRRILSWESTIAMD